MTNQYASVAALGACAVGAAMLLVQPTNPPGNRDTADSSSPGAGRSSSPYSSADAAVTRTHAALMRMQLTPSDHDPSVHPATARRAPAHPAPAHPAPAHPASARRAALALCHDCAASHALVRVMQRRQRFGYELLPVLVLVDRRWPALDAFVAASAGSSITVIPTLKQQVHVTPVALPAPGIQRRRDRPHSLVIGVPDVAALLTPALLSNERLRP